MTISLFVPFISAEARDFANSILQTRFIGEGEVVKRFEEAIKYKLGFPYALLLNSATSGLRLSLEMAGVGPGDSVITPALTCTATNMPILEQYANPQFADIQDTGAIDPNDIEHRITEKTKAIMCVHYGGYPCDMDELHAIADKHNLPLIEDAAQAIGAQYKGRNIGTISRFTVFSFQAIKQLTTVDGGLITLSDENDYEEAKQRRWFGIDRDKRTPSTEWPGYSEWPQTMVGYKYNPTNVQAAIGLGNLPYLDDELEYRQRLADFYRMGLVGIPGIRAFEYKQDRICSWFMFMVHVENRMAFHRMMKEKGIETSVCHVRNDHHPVFGKPRTDLPNLDKFQHTYLSLPIHRFVTMEDADYIVNRIKGGW